ncbi:hypothetical protein BDZ97DRAFT_1837517 [Flammula alnicola]|nr:hypothetical protein BDZ97DRAFT_1837517 [Flammula alnicola]
MTEGEGLESVTKMPEHTICFNPRDLSNSSRVILVDTPGFDDTFVEDGEIMQRILNYMNKFHKTARVGVLYLIDPRQRRLPMLDELMSSPKIGGSLLTVGISPRGEMTFANSENSAWDIIDKVLTKEHLVDVAAFRKFLKTLCIRQAQYTPRRSSLTFLGLFRSLFRIQRGESSYSTRC